MEILEKDIEDVVWYLANNNREKLYEIGFPELHRHTLRQVRLGEYGVADIIAWDVLTGMLDGVKLRKVSVQIIEFKKDVIGHAALMQSHRYETAIREILQSFDIHFDEIICWHILVGSDIDHFGDFPFLYSNMHSTIIATYKHDLVDGTKFSVVGKCWSKRDGHGIKEDKINEIKKTLKQQLRNYGKEINRHQ